MSKETSFLASDSINDLSKDFSKAQASFKKAMKDKLNPYFESSYADLSSIIDAIRPILAENNLSFIQTCNDKENHASVSTFILHSSGQWINCGTVSVPVNKKDAQGYGSALTYARRYSLAAAFGVATEDDDANAATHPGVKKPTPVQSRENTKQNYSSPPKPSPIPRPKPMAAKELTDFTSMERILAIQNLAKSLGKGESFLIDSIKKQLGHDNLFEIPKKFGDGLFFFLQKQMDENKKFVRDMG
jgi:hypothetical protein